MRDVKGKTRVMYNIILKIIKYFVKEKAQIKTVEIRRV